MTKLVLLGLLNISFCPGPMAFSSLHRDDVFSGFDLGRKLAANWYVFLLGTDETGSRKKLNPLSETKSKTTRLNICSENVSFIMFTSFVCL